MCYIVVKVDYCISDIITFYEVFSATYDVIYYLGEDSLSGLVVRVLGYRSRGPVFIPGSTRFSK
jgi:hypothetical protein